jgi:hypothetical protein
MDRKVLAVLVLAVLNLVAIAANLVGRARDGAELSTRQPPGMGAARSATDHTVTTTFPRLCPASTWRCASTISSNR